MKNGGFCNRKVLASSELMIDPVAVVSIHNVFTGKMRTSLKMRISELYLIYYVVMHGIQKVQLIV